MSAAKPFVLSIAGLDPSGGAGIVADNKTFEAHHVYGLSVCTAITYQNDISFEGLEWVSMDSIIHQIDTLLKTFQIKWIKVGLISSLELLDTIADHLKQYNQDIKIIWDPIMKASAGFSFHSNLDQKRLLAVAKKIFLITPNTQELQILFPGLSEDISSSLIAEYCSILVKGGHRPDAPDDVLIHAQKKYLIAGKRIMGKEKRGTGCVLSSSILSHLALGDELPDACVKAKRYIEQFISSNKTSLGHHVYC